MLTLYAATTNPGKLRDFSVAALDAGLAGRIRIEPLPSLAAIPAPEEDQPTFAGNARLKAEYYSRLSSGYILADDSGLEVDALHGEPGVRSARYAQDAGYEPASAPQTLSTDERNNLCLLQRLSGIERRSARYHCVLALARNGSVLATADGSVEGEILTAPRGSGGFGYDPLFFLAELGQTMAEISLEQKHTLSHRGRAFRALLPHLQNLPQ
ncbi:MAG: non-canonical purine NTP pyrophosphatase [Acidobacteriaceae bacterium]